jgi:hypothetical protein
MDTKKGRIINSSFNFSAESEVFEPNFPKALLSGAYFF